MGHKAIECYANVNEVEQHQAGAEDSEVRGCSGVWLIGGVEKEEEKERVVVEKRKRTRRWRRMKAVDASKMTPTVLTE